MTESELRILAETTIPPGYHWEIEAYTLTPNELFWRVRCRRDHKLNPQGWHLDIQLGEGIENHWIGDKARKGAVARLIKTSLAVLSHKEQLRQREAQQLDMLRVTEAVNRLLL